MSSSKEVLKNALMELERYQQGLEKKKEEIHDLAAYEAEYKSENIESNLKAVRVLQEILKEQF